MKIAVDVDGVCLNWYANFRKYHDFLPEVPPSWDCIERKHVNKSYKDEKFWCGLQRMCENDELMFEPYCYLTAIPQRWMPQRIRNLQEAGYPDAPVVACIDKLNYCRAADIDFLVDDKPSTVQEFVDAGQGVIQFIPPGYEWPEIDGAIVVRKLSDI